MRKYVALGAMAALGLAGQAGATDGFSYNHIEGSYSIVELDGSSDDGEVAGISGSAAFSPNIFGFAAFNDVDLDGGVSGNQFTLGLGYALPLTSALDITSGVSFERVKTRVAGFGSDTDRGYGLALGLRGKVGSVLELSAGVKYIDLGNNADDTTFSVGGRYFFTPAFALGIDISESDDATTFGVAVRYDFGHR